MLSIKIGNEIQQISSNSTYNINAGDKIEVSPLENAKYQVLIGENEKDVILKVTEENGETYEIVLANLATYLEAGDIIAQLILNLEDQTLTVNNTAELLEALDATAAGGTIGQNQRTLIDAENIDPNRSAAEDSDQLRTRPGFLLEDTVGNDRPYVEDVELLDVEVINGLNVITGQFIAYDPDIGDTHTFALVDGTLSITDDFGVITLIDDNIQVIVNEDGTFSITGDFNQLADGEIATLTFEYTATDNGGLVSNPGLVTLNVEGTNDAPIITLTQSQLLEENVFEDTLYYLHDKVDINFDDVDERGDMKLTLTAENGVINVVLDGTFDVTVENNNSNSVTIFGSNADLEAIFNNTGSAGSYITYMPDANSDADDTIQIILDDQGDNAPENALNDTDNIDLIVDAVVGNVTITMADAQVFEDESVIPVLEVTYTDAADPNETRLLQFTMPEGWEIVEDGANGWTDENGDGIYELDVSALVSEGLDNERDAEVTISVNGPQIITPPNSDVDITDLNIIAQAFESVTDQEITEDNNESSQEIAGTIIVDAVVGNVEINELVVPNVYEDGTITDAYANITLGDVSDSNETYTIQYTLPSGWVVSQLNDWNLQLNTNGTQTLTLNLTQDDLVNIFGLAIEEDNRNQEFSFDVALPFMQTPPNSDVDLSISMLAQAFEDPTDLESDDINNISSDGANAQSIVDAVVGDSAISIVGFMTSEGVKSLDEYESPTDIPLSPSLIGDSDITYLEDEPQFDTDSNANQIGLYEDNSIELVLEARFSDVGDTNETHKLSFKLPEGWLVVEDGLNGWVYNSTTGVYEYDASSLVDDAASTAGLTGERTGEVVISVNAPVMIPPANSDVDVDDFYAMAQAFETVTDQEITFDNNQSSDIDDNDTIIVDAVVGEVIINSVSASNILEDGTVSDGKVTVTFSDVGDENETYVIKFALPEGWSVDTTGTNWTGPNANGMIRLELTQSDLESLNSKTYDGRFDSDTFEIDLPNLTPPPNSDEDVTLKVIAKAFEDVTDLETTYDNNTSKDSEKESIIVDAVVGEVIINSVSASDILEDGTLSDGKVTVTFSDVSDENETYVVKFKLPEGWTTSDMEIATGISWNDVNSNGFVRLTLTYDQLMSFNPTIIESIDGEGRHDSATLEINLPNLTPPPNSDEDVTLKVIAKAFEDVTDLETTYDNNISKDSENETIIVDAVAGKANIELVNTSTLEDTSVKMQINVTYTDVGDTNESHWVTFKVPAGWSIDFDTFNPIAEGWTFNWFTQTWIKDISDIVDQAASDAGLTGQREGTVTVSIDSPNIMPPINSDVDAQGGFLNWKEAFASAGVIDVVSDQEISYLNNADLDFDHGSIKVFADAGLVTINTFSIHPIYEDGTLTDATINVTFNDIGDSTNFTGAEKYKIIMQLPEDWEVDTINSNWTLQKTENGISYYKLNIGTDLSAYADDPYLIFDPLNPHQSGTFTFELPDMTPPPNSDIDTAIKVIAHAIDVDTDDGVKDHEKDNQTDTIIVDAVSGLATIEIINTSTYEDTEVTPQLKITLTDVDDVNENHWVTFNAPAGWSVTEANGWTYLGLGSWGKDISTLVDSLADDNGTDSRYDSLELTIDAPTVIPPANSDYDAQGGFLNWKEAFATVGVVDVVSDQEITYFNNSDFDADHGTIIVDAVAGEVDLTIIDSQVYEDNSIAPILQVTYTDAGDMDETHYLGFRVPDGWSVTADNGWVYSSVFGMYIKDISSLVDQAAINTGVVGDRDATVTINVTAPTIMPPANSDIDVNDLTAIAAVFDIAHDDGITYANNQNFDIDNEGYIDVIPVNDPPQFDSSDNISLVYSEDASIATINVNSGVLSGDFNFEALASDIDDTDEDLHISKINGQTVDPTSGWSGIVEFSYTDQNGNPAIITATLSVNQEGEYSITNISDLNPIPSGSTAVASLNFNVADDDGAETPTVKTINISITGDNDNPIITTENDALIFNIDENSAGGAVLGTVESTDIDGSSRIYTFVDSNGNSILSNEFEINPTTGVITVKAGANLDYESQTQYILYVKADDQKGGSDIEQVTININDLVENTPPTINNADYDIVENSAVGAYVGTVSANDIDNDTLTYSLAAGILDNNKFSIDSSTGVVTFIDQNGIDYETMGTDKFYKIEVDVYDGTEHTKKQFNVNILDLDENVTGGGTTIYTDSQPVVDHGTGREHWSKTTITLADFAGQTFSFTFNIDDYGGDSEVSSIKFYDSLNNLIYSDISDFPSGNFDITVENVVVPDDGIINVVIDADHNASYELVSYSVVSGLIESDQILTLEEVDTNVNDDIAGDNIDMAQLLSSAEDFNPDSVPSSLDEIDLSSGAHILSNLSVDDFLAITDDDKTLKITSIDGNDTIKLELTDTGVGSEHWYDTGNNVVDVDNGRTYSTYTNAADTSIQLLIDESITVEDN